MIVFSTTILFILLLNAAYVFGQFEENYQLQREEEDIDSSPYDMTMLTEEKQGLMNTIVSADVYSNEYFPAVAVASFTGPNIIGEFSFFQDAQGQVTATGAIQKGLKQDLKYKFSFYDGPSCNDLGRLLLEHEFSSMHVVSMGATPPIQETIPELHLTGENGYIGVPWVLSDNYRNLACVILKGDELE